MPLLNVAGTFPATVTRCEIEELPGKDPTVRIAFATAQGDITAWLNLRTEVSPGKKMSPFDVTLETLRNAFGFDDNFETLTGQVVGKRVEIVTELRSWNGAEQCRVKYINDPANPRKAAASSPAAKSTLKALTQHAKKTPRSTPAPATKLKQATPPAPAPADDEPLF
jgi:hypothetical protein